MNECRGASLIKTVTCCHLLVVLFFITSFCRSKKFENHLYKLQATEAAALAPLIKVYTLHDAVQAQNQ